MLHLLLFRQCSHVGCQRAITEAGTVLEPRLLNMSVVPSEITLLHSIGCHACCRLPRSLSQKPLLQVRTPTDKHSISRCLATWPCNAEWLGRASRLGARTAWPVRVIILALPCCLPSDAKPAACRGRCRASWWRRWRGAPLWQLRWRAGRRCLQQTWLRVHRVQVQILLQVRLPTACSCVLQQCAVSCRQQARQSTRCCTAVSIAHRHNLADDLYPAAECCEALCPPECDILCITTSETETHPWLQRGDMVLLWDAPHVHPAPHPLESEPWQCGCCGLSWSEVMPAWHSACPQWQRESQSGVRALPQSLIPLAPLAWYEMSSCPVMTTPPLPATCATSAGVHSEFC